MSEINFEGYNINEDQLKEVKSIGDLIRDTRFLHNHTGSERNKLCVELFQLVNEGKTQLQEDVTEPSTDDTEDN